MYKNPEIQDTQAEIVSYWVHEGGVSPLLETESLNSARENEKLGLEEELGYPVLS